MRIWIHEGPGHYIGSCIMCTAETEENARAVIQSYMDQMGLKEPINLRWYRLDVEGCFYAHDGDY